MCPQALYGRTYRFAENCLTLKVINFQILFLPKATKKKTNKHKNKTEKQKSKKGKHLKAKTIITKAQLCSGLYEAFLESVC